MQGHWKYVYGLKDVMLVASSRSGELHQLSKNEDPRRRARHGGRRQRAGSSRRWVLPFLRLIFVSMLYILFVGHKLFLKS
jgi:hypothetical protein